MIEDIRWYEKKVAYENITVTEMRLQKKVNGEWINVAIVKAGEEE